MDRRRLLVAGSTAVTAGLAGCSSIFNDEDERPQEPFLRGVRIVSDAGTGRVTGEIVNPTEETIDMTVYARIHSEPQLDGNLRNQDPEEELSNTINGIDPTEPGTAGAAISGLQIPGVYTISRLSDNIEAALVQAGETPAESEYQWYGPDSDTLNAEGQ